MTLRKPLIIKMAIFLVFGIGFIAYYWRSAGYAAPPGQEIYRVGNRDVILGGEGDSSVGGFKPPTGSNSRQRAFTAKKTRTIALAFTCVGEKPLYNDIIPAFKDYWRQKTGEEVEFAGGYALTDFDTIATSVFGNPVEVLLMSSASDPLRRGYEHTKWHKLPNAGIVYSYPEVFVVRKGNPRNIRTYNDLANPGIKVIHCNPLEAAGMWPLYGIYGSALKESEINTGNKDIKAAFQRLLAIEENSFYGNFKTDDVVQLFLDGYGDVLVVTESAALNMVKNNDSVEIVRPPYTVVADQRVYVLKKNIPPGDQQVVDEFVDFLFNRQSQESFAKYNFRPSDPAVLSENSAKFPELQDPFPIEYLGNATQLKKDLILDKWLRINNIVNQDQQNGIIDGGSQSGSGYAE